MAQRVSQIELISGIANVLERMGCTDASPRHFNAIVGAANLIVEEYNRDDVKATDAMGLRAWLASDDTGMSSRFMAFVLAPLAGLGSVPNPRNDFQDCPPPYDPDDFGRCYRLLRAVPELRRHIPAMGTGHGAVWARLAAEWAELEALYEKELPSGKAPELYRRMQAIHKAAK
jgi:hypothetical protein